MDFFSDLAGRIAGLLGKTVQGHTPSQSVRDYQRNSSSYSIEREISETLANLTVMLSTMPISGDSERAKWLDGISDKFYQLKISKLLSTAFISGDCLVIPSWNGRNIQNVLVPSKDFEILEAIGDEITACAYVVDRAKKGTQEYQLVQSVELVPYTSVGGERLYANRYRMFVACNWSLTAATVNDFPQWRDKYEKEWSILNVDRLLIGRFKSFTTDTDNINSVKGSPICFGASEPIREYRYLLSQMHDEFGLSEKFIVADKRFFRKSKTREGEEYTELPRGKERVFMDVASRSDKMEMHDWSPDIRYNAYLAALDKQEKLLERAVGVSSGIISTPDDINYQNVDNVRKSQQKTMSFVNAARSAVEDCMNDLVYSWNILANYYGIVPIGDYSVSFDWSDDYIETFADRQNAILAGEAIGATDAADYRQFLFDESPEAARERVAEIKANRDAEVVPLTIESV